MKMHYMFAPATPVAVELYLDREHFSVRTSGLPNIGIQGVCFGHVVAAMSPKSEPFNWGNVLWHELGHVFAIQLSKNHVPRWFTEGLSEYETMIRRPEWQRELDPELYLALKNGRLPGALDMNRAFTHAEGDLDVTVAYYAASQMLAFTAEQFGFARITRALELWGEGKTTAQVLSEAFGVSPAEYDARFRAWAMARLARYDGQYLFDPKPIVAGGGARRGRRGAAERAGARRLRRRAPPREEGRRREPGDRRGAQARRRAIATRTSSRPSSRQRPRTRTRRRSTCARSWPAGGDGYTVEMALAAVAEARKDKARLARRARGGASLRSDAGGPAARALRPRDGREARRRRARRRSAKWRASISTIVRAYKLLLGRLGRGQALGRGEARRRRRRSTSTSRAPRSTWTTRAPSPRAATMRRRRSSSRARCSATTSRRSRAVALALLAAERLALGDVAGARARRDEALKLDPDSAEARALKL